MSRSTHEAPTAASGFRRPQGERYTRVAIILHWSIAALIIYGLASGFLIWEIATEFFRSDPPLYMFWLTSHLSAGLTVLVLTVVRIVWRLMHEPPPYPYDMKRWERHSAHFAHFFLYAVMLLMPLTGWAILSANPPAGSAGAKALQVAMTAAAPARRPPPGPLPPPPRIWWVLMPMPVITPLQDLGAEPGGVGPQQALHKEITDWHMIGGWLSLLLLLLHVAGALKHQWFDRHLQLQRMGIGKRPTQL
jgi:cytochrome b561